MAPPEVLVNRIRKAVITAAGRGTRHFPATRSVQKELFPLVDRDGVTKPVLQIVVEEALESGIEKVCIVCSPLSIVPIREHFAPVTAELRASFASKPQALAEADRLERIAEAVEFVVQPEPDGYGDAVLCSRPFVGDEPFLLLLGDHLYASQTGERCSATVLHAFHRLNAPVSGVTLTPMDQLRLFGVVTGDRVEGEPPTYRVRDMVEKPTPDVARTRLRTAGVAEDLYLSFFGMHALPARVYDHLAERKARDLRESGEIQLTSSLEALVREGAYYAVEVPGLRLDMGVPEGLTYTQAVLAMASPYHAILEDVVRRQADLRQNR